MQNENTGSIHRTDTRRQDPYTAQASRQKQKPPTYAVNFKPPVMALLISPWSRCSGACLDFFRWVTTAARQLHTLRKTRHWLLQLTSQVCTMHKLLDRVQPLDKRHAFPQTRPPKNGPHPRIFGREIEAISTTPPPRPGIFRRNEVVQRPSKTGGGNKACQRDRPASSRSKEEGQVVLCLCMEPRGSFLFRGCRRDEFGTLDTRCLCAMLLVTLLAAGALLQHYCNARLLLCLRFV